MSIDFFHRKMHKKNLINSGRIITDLSHIVPLEICPQISIISERSIAQISGFNWSNLREEITQEKTISTTPVP
jgi:hypothetical protein